MHIVTSTPPRTLSIFNGIGASAHLVQGRSLLAARLHIGQPTIVLVLAGRKTVYGDEGHCSASSGSVMLLPQGATCDVRNETAEHGAYEAIALFIDPALLDEVSTCVSLFAPVRQACVLPRIGTGFHHALLRANQLMQERSAPPAIVRHAITEVLIWMQLAGHRFAPMRQESFVERLRSVLARTPAEPWSAGLAAAALHVSEATLRRRLAHEHWNMSRLLQEVRLTYAMTLLQSGDDYIGEVAGNVGFANHAHFSRLFKKRFGITPTELRHADKMAS
jgi:AraC-like DNA-binding protein